MVSKRLLSAMTLVVVLVLLCHAVEAGVIARLDSIAVAALVECGVPSTGNAQVTLASVYRMINVDAITVSHDFPAVEYSDTVIVHADTAEYTLGSRFLWPGTARNQYVSSDDPPLDGLKILRYLDDASIFEAKGGGLSYTQQVDDPSGPDFYSCFGTTIKFTPAPSYTDTVFMTYYTEANFMSSASDTTKIIPAYRPALVWLVCYDILTRKGDNIKASLYLKRYMELKGSK